MTLKVKIITLGCPKNLVDSRQMKGYLAKEGYRVIEEIANADIIVVNTCGFIEDAKRESIETIIELLRYKEQGSCRHLIVAGCLAQKYGDELVQEIPEIDAVIGTGDIPILPEIIERLSFEKNIKSVGNPNAFLYNEGLPKISAETGHYAYLKIAEGCDNACTYCVIPSMRGAYRSRKKEDIVEEAKEYAKTGVKEIILIAQDTTLYGYDLYGRLELPKLLQELAKIDGIRWIRMLYSYPNNITGELLHIMKNEKKICSYIDLPLQHIADSVLQRMGRPMTKKETKELIGTIRRIVPGIVLRSTFIVGFPGETREEYTELVTFIKEIGFDRAGFFVYSKEAGTKAAGLAGQINIKEKNRRLEEIKNIQEDILSKKQAAKIGQEMLIFVDGPSKDYEGLWEGRTEGDAPEIDGVVYFVPQPNVIAGNLLTVRITHSQEFALMGEIIK